MALLHLVVWSLCLFHSPRIWKINMLSGSSKYGWPFWATAYRTYLLSILDNILENQGQAVPSVFAAETSEEAIASLSAEGNFWANPHSLSWSVLRVFLILDSFNCTYIFMRKKKIPTECPQSYTYTHMYTHTVIPIYSEMYIHRYIPLF